MKKLMAYAATAAKVTGACPATKKRNQVGNINALQVGVRRKWALFREAKRRLEHGVPVDVLIRDVTWKLRTFSCQSGEVTR